MRLENDMGDYLLERQNCIRELSRPRFATQKNHCAVWAVKFRGLPSSVLVSNGVVLEVAVGMTYMSSAAVLLRALRVTTPTDLIAPSRANNPRRRNAEGFPLSPHTHARTHTHTHTHTRTHADMYRYTKTFLYIRRRMRSLR